MIRFVVTVLVIAIFMVYHVVVVAGLLSVFALTGELLCTIPFATSLLLVPEKA